MGDGRDTSSGNQGGTADNTGSSLNDELQQTRKKWRAGFNEVAPAVWQPPKSSGGWSSNTPGSDQGGSQDPNANGDQGKPVWRATPGAVPSAGGDNTQTGAPTGPAAPADDGHWHPSTNKQPEMKLPGTGDKTSPLAKQAAASQKSLDDALRWHTGLLGNEITAGASAVFARGVGSRMLSAGARNWLVNTELPAGPALFVHRNFGLKDDGKFFGQISRKESVLAGDIADSAANLKDQVDVIQKSLVPRALSEEEQAKLVRYYELQNKTAPPGFKPGSGFTDDDKALGQEFVENDGKIKGLRPLVDKVNEAWEPAVKQQLEANDAIDTRIAGMAEKIDAAKTAGGTPDADLVARHDYLTEFRKNPDAPRPAGLKLDDIDELNVGKAKKLNEQITKLRPGKEAEAELERMEARNDEIGKEFQKRAQDIKAEAEGAERKWMGAEASVATAEEKRVLQRYRFLSGGGMDEVTKGVLTPEEEKMVRAHQGLQERLGLMPHDAALAESQKLRTAIQAQSDKLTPEVTAINAKLAADPNAVLTDAEKTLKARHDFLKSGADGVVPKEAQGSFTAQEEDLIARRRIFGSPAGIAELENGRRAMKGEVEKLTAKLKDEGLQLEHRATLPGNTFSEEEKSVLERFRYFKNGAIGKAPDLSKLAPEEAAILGRRSALETRMAGMLEDSKLQASKGFKATANDFAQGWLIGEGISLVDDATDRLFHGRAALHNQGYGKSLIVPATILTPGGFWAKTAAGAATALLGHGLDSIAPADKNPEFSRFMRPNSIEAITVTGALMIPMKEESLGLRAAIAGTAWLGSHLTNFLGSRSAEDIKNDAVATWSKDTAKRTFGTMKDAVEEMKTLSSMGREGDAQVHTWFANWRSTQHADPITAHRGDAILSTAIGEHTMELGLNMGYHNGNTDSFLSSVLKGHNPQEQDYLLAGENIDIGGGAMKYLRFASKSVDDAKTATQAQIGKDDHGKTVSDSELADLDKMKQRIQDDQAKIYGQHDIDKVYNALEQYTWKLGQDRMQKVYDKLKSDIQTGSKDKQFLAKLYRDLALVDLVWAGSKVGYRGVGGGTDGASAKILYGEAANALAQARNLDNTNQDLAQIDAIRNDLASSIPNAQQAQQDSTTLNPLQVDGTQP